LHLKASLRIRKKNYSELAKPRYSRQKKDRSERKSRKKNRNFKVKKDRCKHRPNKHFSKAEGIEATEIERRKAVGECLRCTWPSDRKGNYRVKDCVRSIKLDKGTASYPKDKEYQRMKIAGLLIDSISNWSGYPASSPGLDRLFGSVQFQTRPKT
jgi:hypothetical protein